MHVHVRSAEGEAKYWLVPSIELARNNRLSRVQLNEIKGIVEAHQDELIAAWQYHFKGSRD
jgi:hypothetical protein